MLSPHDCFIVISAILSGLSAGMLVAMPISGFLSEYGFSGGWPSVFYFFGEYMVLVCFVLLSRVKSTKYKYYNYDDFRIVYSRNPHKKNLHF